MRVLVVEPSGKGGMIHYAWQLCQAMQEEGAEVTLLTDRHYELGALAHSFELRCKLNLWDPKPDSETSSMLGRRLRRLYRAFVYYREWLRVVAISRRLQPDVIQLGDIRFGTDLVPILWLGRASKVIVDICHNVRPFSGGSASSGRFELSSLQRFLYRRIYARFDTIFVHYRVNAKEFATTFPDSAHKVVPIVHGNEEIFRHLSRSDVSAESLRERLGVEEEKEVLLFFGTLSPYKGLDLLLDAFESVAKRNGRAMLILAGYAMSPFDPEEYLAEASRRGLDSRVRIVNEYIPSGEIAAWMRLARAVVFPYHSIYQSGALHVAQTFGVPIVATRVGAMEEVIRDGESGLLTEPGDAADLASGLLALLDDESLAERLGDRARADALERFSWSGVARVVLGSCEAKLEERKQ